MSKNRKISAKEAAALIGDDGETAWQACAAAEAAGMDYDEYMIELVASAEWDEKEASMSQQKAKEEGDGK